MVPSRWEDRPQVWSEVLRVRVWFERRARKLRFSGGSVDRARELLVAQVFDDHQQPRRL